MSKIRCGGIVSGCCIMEETKVEVRRYIGGVVSGVVCVEGD
jgi:hypothetical protein